MSETYADNIIMQRAINYLDKAGLSHAAQALRGSLSNGYVQMTKEEMLEKTEERLTVLDFMRKRIARLEQRLEDLKENGIQQRSKDIVIGSSSAGFSPSDPLNIEKLEFLIEDHEAEIIGLRKAVMEVEDAMREITGTSMYRILSLYYWQDVSEPEIAKLLQMQESQVTTVRKSALMRIATLIYGYGPVYKLDQETTVKKRRV